MQRFPLLASLLATAVTLAMLAANYGPPWGP
jgi:hypothetical protein